MSSWVVSGLTISPNISSLCFMGPGAGPYARDGAKQRGADAVEAEQKQVADGRDREQPAHRPPQDCLLAHPFPLSLVDALDEGPYRFQQIRLEIQPQLERLGHRPELVERDDGAFVPICDIRPQNVS